MSSNPKSHLQYQMLDFTLTSNLLVTLFLLILLYFTLYIFQGASFSKLYGLRKLNSVRKKLRFNQSFNWYRPGSSDTSVSRYSLERRWSSRTFRYGYLVTTSPQSSAPPSAASPLRLDYWLRVLQTLMVWRAVCTRPGNVFTAVCWPAITSNSDFM
jgi:hypothetical protein